MKNNVWIIDVLDDLIEFANINRLSNTQQALQAAFKTISEGPSDELIEEKIPTASSDSNIIQLPTAYRQ